MATNRRHTKTSILEAEITRLREALADHQISEAFGCYTRKALTRDLLPGFDARGFAIVYLDIDSLTLLNEAYGKAERKNADVPSVNERIFASFAAMRSADVLIGQWFSGDEFVALVPAADAYGFTQRLQAELRANGITATFVLQVYDHSITLREAIDLADNETSKYKLAGLRDRIHIS